MVLAPTETTQRRSHGPALQRNHLEWSSAALKSICQTPEREYRHLFQGFCSSCLGLGFLTDAGFLDSVLWLFLYLFHGCNPDLEPTPSFLFSSRILSLRLLKYHSGQHVAEEMDNRERSYTASHSQIIQQGSLKSPPLALPTSPLDAPYDFFFFFAGVMWGFSLSFLSELPLGHSKKKNNLFSCLFMLSNSALSISYPEMAWTSSAYTWVTEALCSTTHPRPPTAPHASGGTSGPVTSGISDSVSCFPHRRSRPGDYLKDEEEFIYCITSALKGQGPRHVRYRVPTSCTQWGI